jgi:O-antigen/teichoic acid export membrane protein
MMSEVLKKIGRHSLVYGAGTLIGRAVGFLMVPFYTHFLSPADYGVLELLDLTTFFLSTVVGLGLSGAIVRFFYDFQDEGQRHEVVSTAVLFGIAVLGGAYLILQPLCPVLSNSLFDTPVYSSYFHIIFASLCFDTTAELGISYIRAKQQSVVATAFSLARLVASLTLNVYFIVVHGMGVYGILFSSLISSLALAVVLTVITLREVGLGFSRAKLGAMVRYSLPLIPMSLGMFVLNFSDRFFLQHYASLTEVGIYSLGYKFGMASGVLVTSPFLLFWGAYAYEVVERPNGRELVARLQVYFTAVLLASTLAIAMLAEPIVRFMSPPQYWRAAHVIPIVGLGYVLLGLSYFFRVGLQYTKRTKFLGYAVGASALLNLPLNFILIPRFHAMGAAWATLLSFVVLSLVTCQVAQRNFVIPYEYTRLAKLLGAGAIVFGASKLFPVTGLVPSLVIDVACLTALPFLLHGLRFFEDSELDRARAFAETLVRRVGPTRELP